MNEVLEQYSPDDYLQLLSSETRSQVEALHGQGVPLDAVAQILASEPGTGLATKGGTFWPSDLLERILNELRILICTDQKKYGELRKLIKSEGSKNARALVVLIATMVATQIGMAAALCVPLVALLLAAALKVSLAGWCKAIAPKPTIDAPPPLNPPPPGDEKPV